MELTASIERRRGPQLWVGIVMGACIYLPWHHFAISKNAVHVLQSLYKLASNHSLAWQLCVVSAFYRISLAFLEPSL